MKQFAFTIFDNAVNVYSPPIFVNHPAIAQRYFLTLAQDQKSDVARFPSQFHLFELGSFDDADGTFSLHATPISHGLASQFVQPPTEA